MDKLNKIIKNQRLVKYFAMAVTIVLIELATFQLVYFLNGNYYLATVLSFALAVVLNWVGGRAFVFGTSRHHPLREFIMVLIASIVGVLIQLAVVHISVNVLLFYPLIGKVLSVGFSFFCNYWFRAIIVYRE